MDVKALHIIECSETKKNVDIFFPPIFKNDLQSVSENQIKCGMKMWILESQNRHIYYAASWYLVQGVRKPWNYVLHIGTGVGLHSHFCVKLKFSWDCDNLAKLNKMWL